MATDLEKTILNISKNYRIGIAELAALLVCEGLTSAEIAAIIGTSRQCINARMGQLKAKGFVTSKPTGKCVTWHRGVRANVMLAI
jgi:CRP-like cAMP-binding protein